MSSQTSSGPAGGGVLAGQSPVGIAAPEFRLPANIELGAVRLQVSNLERSLAYYEGVLGLAVLDRSSSTAVLGVAGDAALVKLFEEPGVAPVPRGGRLGLYHFAILMPDRAALGRFADHLIRMGIRFGASDHLVSEALYLNDPDGLGIEVYADRPRSSWRTSGGQLEMATHSLDVEDLIQSAAGLAWSGMPVGTRMGHVHLHVGDLERAAAFYHSAIGLDKIVWGYPGALFLSAGGYHHHLGINTWAAGAAPAGQSDARLLDWQIILPDADALKAAVESLQNSGFTVTADDGGDHLVKDPWGTGLRLSVKA